MLRTLRRHPLLVGTGEVLIDTAHYVAVVLVVPIVLAQAVKLAL